MAQLLDTFNVDPPHDYCTPILRTILLLAVSQHIFYRSIFQHAIFALGSDGTD